MLYMQVANMLTIVMTCISGDCDILQNIPAQLLYVVSDEYFYDKHSSVEIRDSLLDLLGDVFFVVPALITARYHRGESVQPPPEPQRG